MTTETIESKMNPFSRKIIGEYALARTIGKNTNEILLRELQRIAGEYETARTMGDTGKINSLIDFELRTLLYQEQHSRAILSGAYGLFSFEMPTNEERIQSLGESVLDNGKWHIFSQKLKSRVSLRDLPQLVQK